jgi:hypothetical protein
MKPSNLDMRLSNLDMKPSNLDMNVSNLDMKPSNPYMNRSNRGLKRPYFIFYFSLIGGPFLGYIPTDLNGFALFMGDLVASIIANKTRRNIPDDEAADLQSVQLSRTIRPVLSAAGNDS